ncbi:hypothetical protein D3C80_1948930 [compost metagenome]
MGQSIEERETTVMSVLVSTVVVATAVLVGTGAVEEEYAVTSVEVVVRENLYSMQEQSTVGRICSFAIYPGYCFLSVGCTLMGDRRLPPACAPCAFAWYYA